MKDLKREKEWSAKSLSCLRLTPEGWGVCQDEGIVTFVPGLLPGETGVVKITERRKNWQRAELLSIENMSAQRVQPPCSVFGLCGGCQLQHTTYEETLFRKTTWVKDALYRIGKIDVDVQPALGMEFPWRYRNKVRLHRDETGRLGYYQEKSKRIIPFADCLLFSEPMNRWVKDIQKLLGQRFPEIHEVTIRQNSKGEGLWLFTQKEPNSQQHKGENRNTIKGRFYYALKELIEESLASGELTGVQSLWVQASAGDLKHLWGKHSLIEEILGLRFQVSPLAFLQVNHLQTEILYSKVLELAEPGENDVIWDLYSGIGTLTLALARYAKKVWGIEENPYAVKDAMLNSELNELFNVEFLQGKVEDTLGKVEDSLGNLNGKPKIVVLDPPRAGADRRVIDRLLHIHPERIVYVSCDPKTLARDLGLLVKGGYSVETVQPVDMFPWTQHVETVVRLDRKHTTKYGVNPVK